MLMNKGWRGNVNFVTAFGVMKAAVARMLMAEFCRHWSEGLLSLPQQIPFSELAVRVTAPQGDQLPTHPYPLFQMCP